MPPTSRGHRVRDESDIGLCDACGTEEGPRRRLVVPAVIDGETRDVVGWFCEHCADLAES
jgi:hypothetical protein